MRQFTFTIPKACLLPFAVLTVLYITAPLYFVLGLGTEDQPGFQREISSSEAALADEVRVLSAEIERLKANMAQFHGLAEDLNIEQKSNIEPKDNYEITKQSDNKEEKSLDVIAATQAVMTAATGTTKKPVFHTKQDDVDRNKMAEEIERGAVHLDPKDKVVTGKIIADVDKRDAVKEAMHHAFSGYAQYAFGKDEVRPLSNTAGNDFGGLGASIVDALDTLYIMDMKDEFERCRDWVARELTFDKDVSVSFFETTIRYLGGLLATFELTEDSVFLDKAVDLGDRLLGAFSTGSGLPLCDVNLRTGRGSCPSWSGGSVTFAETATVQMEFRKLTELTGDDRYWHASAAVIDKLRQIGPADGLYGMFLNYNSGKVANPHVTFGARGDSAYEYFLKVWLQSGKNEDTFESMYRRSMDGMTTQLLQRSAPSGLPYIAERARNGNLVHKMDHLVCFVPGMLALGYSNGVMASSAGVDFLDLAEGMAETCYELYRRQKTGLAPEIVKFRPGQDFGIDAGDRHNLLRPETVESLFVLYRLTGKQRYRDWGWDIFEAFNTHARHTTAFTSLDDVTVLPPRRRDRMESYFLAETLKYLYLLFCDESVIPLDKYVFNTEAHPFRIESQFSARGG
eukprot:Rmarinus@m.15161